VVSVFEPNDMITNRRQILCWLALSAASVAAALSISACVATVPVASSVPGDEAQSQSQSQGRVVMRVSAVGLKFLNSFALLLRPVKGGEPIQLKGWGMGSDGYWSSYYDEVEKGELVSVALPAGDYEIHSFVATASAWGSPRTVSPEKGFSFSFHVNAGETVYLGNLLMRFHGDSGVSSVKMGTVQIDGQRRIAFEPIARDTRSRDFKEIESRFPGLKPDQLKVRLLK
jgi:hypothetical protein